MSTSSNPALSLNAISRDLADGAFLHPAATSRRWLRLPAFAGLSVVFMVLALIVMGIAAVLTGPDFISSLSMETGVPEGPNRLLGESAFVVVLAGSLGGMALAILCAAAVCYRRSLRSFLWPERKLDLGLLFGGFLAMAVVAGALSLLWGLFDPTVWNSPLIDADYAPDTRMIYAAAMAGMLLIAAAAEEVVFRGVLLQITAGFTRRVWLLCLINGLLFSAIHLDPDPIAFVARGLMGMVWAWAALRLGGLEFGIGAHWANNLLIALFAAPFSEAAMPGQESPVITLFPEALSMLLVFFAIEALARRRGPARLT